MRHVWVLYDVLDATYHAGGGRWCRTETGAEKYYTLKDAVKALDNVDCLRVMRRTLRIVFANGGDSI